MKTSSISSNIAAMGLFIAAGLIVVGLCINKGLQSFANKERVVTVKGLAEQYITATEAAIVITSMFSGDIPKELISNMELRISDISKYLNSHGHNNFTIGSIDIQDKNKYYEYQWVGNSNMQVKIDRFQFTRSITIVQNDVEAAQKVAKGIELDLINSGMVSKIRCEYKFPELNSIKPQLIAESTKNARLAGEQFAKDSQSKLGKIKTASQGQITIAGRYSGYYDYDDADNASTPEEPYIQKARVVSSIVFFLED
jgi:hypothetical protein